MALRKVRARGSQSPRGDSGVRPSILLRFQLSEIALPEDAAEAVWVQVATEGEYRGYGGGRAPFKFDRLIFDQVVANIRNHPSYVAGTDGRGTADVVPWDYNHGSEQDPSGGNFQVVGAPAQGWTRDFEVRTGPDGKAELWALTRWLEPARTYIREKRYKWASVALGFDALDPATGERVGALITSIALTNTPFIEGMAELAANRNRGRAAAKTTANQPEVVELEYWYSAACSAEDAVEKLRQLFELSPTAGMPELMGEIAKLQAMDAAGSEPLGVDLDEVYGAIRQILNLPALSGGPEVIAELGKLIERLAVEETSGLGPDQSQPAAAAVQTTENDEAMTKILASKLSVKENDDAINGAVDGLVSIRAAVVSAHKLSATASDKVLLDALEGFAAAQAKIGALLKALGVEDADGAVAKVTDLMQRASQLEAVMPELASLRETAKEGEKTQREEDVSTALTAHFSGDEKARDVLLVFHETKGRAAFLAKYPAPPADKRFLTTTVASGAEGSGAPTATTSEPVGTGSGGQRVIQLAGYAGRNKVERIMAWIKGNVPGADKYTYEQLTEAAWKLNRQTDIKFAV